MKFFFTYLLILLISTSCDNNDGFKSESQSTTSTNQTYIINGEIKYVSEIPDGFKNNSKIKYIADKFPKLNRKNSSKILGQTIINFNYGITDYPNSGCTDERYDHNSASFYTVGVYGPNPVNRDGFLVRGYGRPYHNFYYNTLVLNASNKGRTVLIRGQNYNDNLSKGSAISIEYNFKANVSYDIEVETYFRDNRYLLDKVYSSGFPTLHAQLKDSGIIIEGDAACNNDLVRLATEFNYIKSYTLDSQSAIIRTVTFKFSPLQAKNAVVFALQPAQGARAIDAKIPINNFTMGLYSVKINEKTFDPSYNEIPPSRGGGRGNL